MESMIEHPHILQKQGEYYAGKHLLIDIFGSEKINNVEFVEKTLEESAILAGATVLKTSFHRFPMNSGLTGVCLLSESHISIHTWPEFGFAAIDIFMCGDADPRIAANYIEREFQPDRTVRTTHERGLGNLLVEEIA